MNDQDNSPQKNSALKKLLDNLLVQFKNGEKDKVIITLAKLIKKTDELNKPGAKLEIIKFVNENPEIQAHFYDVQQQKLAQTNSKPLPTCKEITLPFLPSQVNIQHIYPNGKLLSDSQIDKIKKLDAMLIIKGKGKDRYSKKELNTDYSIIKINDQYFAIYTTLGEGGKGKAKLMQNLDTGEWTSLKIIKNEVGSAHSSAKSDVKKEMKGLIASDQNIGDSPVIHKAAGRDEAGHLTTFEKYSMGMKYAHGVEMANYFLESTPDISSTKYLEYGLAFLKAYKEQVADKNNVHRDIKLENAILDLATGKVTIVDSGSVISKSEAKIPLRERVGTETYKAPEISGALTDSYLYTEATDMWAAAISLARMYHFTDDDEVDDYGNMASKFLTFEGTEDNPCFPDDETRRQVHQFLKKMLELDPLKREFTSVDAAMMEFEKIIAPIPKLDKTRHIAILDINEYFNADPQQKLKLELSLKQVDEVWFLNADPESTVTREPKALQKIQRELESANIFVARRLFTSPTSSIQDGVDALLNTVKNENTNFVRGYSFITTNKNVNLEQTKINTVRADTTDVPNLKKKFNSSQAVINDAQIITLIKQLNQEVSRLKTDYFGYKKDSKEYDISTERISKLEKVVVDLDLQFKKKSKPITFGTLEGNLKKLEKEMTSTGIKAFKSTGERNIADIRKSLHVGKAG